MKNCGGKKVKPLKKGAFFWLFKYTISTVVITKIF